MALISVTRLRVRSARYLPGFLFFTLLSALQAKRAAGFFIAFGVKWIGSKTFAFFVKLPEAEARGLAPKMTRYEAQWKEAVYYIDPSKTSPVDFVSLFEKAYSRLTSQ